MGAAVLALGLALATPAQGFEWPGRSEKPKAPGWGYSGDLGPAAWGGLAPVYATCKDGKTQSPIDLRYARRSDYVPLSFHYRSDALSMTNDGHGIQVDSAPGSYLLVNGREYVLEGFQFHTPSEHRIQGLQADMELQLIHRDGQGRRAVVAVLMRAGRHTNSTLSRIAERLPASAGEKFYGRQVATNPLFLLPTERSYFRYPGSLTTPPCTEEVDWFVMAEPVEVDAALIDHFRQVQGPNARPLQPDNARPVNLFSRR
jgi:carbonic anhydrase